MKTIVIIAGLVAFVRSGGLPWPFVALLVASTAFALTA